MSDQKSAYDSVDDLSDVHGLANAARQALITARALPSTRPSIAPDSLSVDPSGISDWSAGFNAERSQDAGNDGGWGAAVLTGAASVQPLRNISQVVALIPGGVEPASTAAALPGTSMEAAKAIELANFKALMRNAEGDRSDLYMDSRKIPTVGIGHRVAPEDHLNLGDVISKDRENQFFDKDGRAALAAARVQAAEAGINNSDFIPHLAAVNFQLGPHWTDKFNKTWDLIKSGNYSAAADEAARSKWNTQSPTRVTQFQNALRALPPRSTP